MLLKSMNKQVFAVTQDWQGVLEVKNTRYVPEVNLPA